MEVNEGLITAQTCHSSVFPLPRCQEQEHSASFFLSLVPGSCKGLKSAGVGCSEGLEHLRLLLFIPMAV